VSSCWVSSLRHLEGRWRGSWACLNETISISWLFIRRIPSESCWQAYRDDVAYTEAKAHLETARHCRICFNSVWRLGLRLAGFASNLNNGLACDIKCYSSFFGHLFALLSYKVLVCNMLECKGFRNWFVIRSYSSPVLCQGQVTPMPPVLCVAQSIRSSKLC
jgi:hypothetical protein